MFGHLNLQCVINEILTPDAAAPDVAAPDVTAPDVAAPDVAAPDAAALDVAALDVPENGLEAGTGLLAATGGRGIDFATTG